MLELRRRWQRVMRTSCSREIEQLTGRKVVGFMSDNHIDPDIAVEVFILEPVGAGPRGAGGDRGRRSGAIVTVALKEVPLPAVAVGGLRDAAGLAAWERLSEAHAHAREVLAGRDGVVDQLDRDRRRGRGDAAHDAALRASGWC